jgi:hypothetical protein
VSEFQLTAQRKPERHENSSKACTIIYDEVVSKGIWKRKLEYTWLLICSVLVLPYLNNEDIQTLRNSVEGETFIRRRYVILDGSVSR